MAERAWRYLTADGVDAAAGLAFDEAMMLRYGRGEVPPAPATLRLYTYRAHCALVGRYQSLEDEIDLEACREEGAQVGRRPTGGGAILMGPGQLGVAIAARAAAAETPREALRRFAAGVVGGLAELGIAAAFRAKNDLETGGRKIAGLGLYLDSRGATLFHASVLVDLDVELMLRLLRIPGAKLADKAAAGVHERVTTVSRELGRPLAAAEVRDAFAAGLARAFAVGLAPGALDAGEQTHLAALAARYAGREWIHQRSPRRDARGSALLKTPEGLLRVFAAVHGDAIKSVLVTGDFNALPPGLARLEAALRWGRADRDRIAAAAGECLAPGELGVPPTAVADAVWEAVAAALAAHAADTAEAADPRSHPERAAGSCYFPDPEPAAVAAQEEPR